MILLFYRPCIYVLSEAQSKTPQNWHAHIECRCASITSWVECFVYTCHKLSVYSQTTMLCGNNVYTCGWVAAAYACWEKEPDWLYNIVYRQCHGELHRSLLVRSMLSKLKVMFIFQFFFLKVLHIMYIPYTIYTIIITLYPSNVYTVRSTCNYHMYTYTIGDANTIVCLSLSSYICGCPG